MIFISRCAEFPLFRDCLIFDQKSTTFKAKKVVFDQIETFLTIRLAIKDETFLTIRLAIKDETFLAIDWQTVTSHETLVPRSRPPTFDSSTNLNRWFREAAHQPSTLQQT